MSALLSKGRLILRRSPVGCWRRPRFRRSLAIRVDANYTADPYGVRFLAWDDNAANLPDAAYIDNYVTNNDLGTYAYAVTSAGTPDYLPFNGTSYYYIYLNAADATASGDANPGDTIVVESNGDTSVQTIGTDNLTVDAVAGSNGLNLLLGAGVTEITLADYDTVNHVGANVDVTGNDLGDTIVGNGGNNTLTGGTGNDTLTGGGGNDTIIGGGGTDKAVYTSTLTASDVHYDSVYNTWTVTAATQGTDTLSGIEKVTDGTHTFLLVDPAGSYTTIQAAINAAGAGDTVLVGAGDYTENVALKSGVNVEGASEAGVVIHGTMTTPGAFDHAAVSNLTVENVGDTMLLDMRGTSEMTDAVFDHVTLSLTGDFTGEIPIGNGQNAGSIALNDGNGDGAGLTFQHVTMDSNDHNFADSTAFVFTIVHSDTGAHMVLDDVTLSGTASGTSTGLGAQWNMTPNSGETAAVDIVNSHTSGGGNFYVSGFDGVTVHDNTFDGQGIDLNGDKNVTVDGNTFQNITDDLTANGTQHRGLVIEDAWGTTGVSDVSVTGNTFNNIDSVDGAIAFQRFTDGTPPDLATIERLNGIDVEGNTFTTLGSGVNPVYLNQTYFGAGAALPSDFHDAQLIIGTPGNDAIVDTSTGPTSIFAGAGNDLITGGAGNNNLTGGTGSDTFVFTPGFGHDTIADYTPGTDMLQFDHTDFARCGNA